MSAHIGEYSMELSQLIQALGDRERAVPASEFDANAPDARHCGIYSWWADVRARQLIGDALGADSDSSIYDPAAPIYIGQTTQTLVHRVLCSHLDGIGKSTLRTTLAAILGATDSDPGTIVGSDMLSDWMREHLEVAIVAIDDPKRFEKRAIRHHDPQLNMRHVSDPSTPPRVKLSELRRRL